MTIAKATGSTKPFAAFEWLLAFRYLRARRKEGSISVIALVSFLGIMAGVAALIVVLSIMNGFRADLFDKILGLNGHIIARPLGRPFDDYREIAAKFKQVPGIVHAIPVVEGQALATTVSTQTNPPAVLVRGIRGQDVSSLKFVANNVRFGTFENFDNSGGLAIGVRLANKLNVVVGSEVTLVTASRVSTPMGMMPRRKTFPVVAVFEMGMSEFDGIIGFVPLKDAQAMFNLEDTAQVLEVMTNKPDNVEFLKSSLQKVAPTDVIFTDWRQLNGTLYSALEVERLAMFVILLLIVAVAALNIISGMIMLVKEKGRDVAILRTMGASSGSILRVFLIAGASIGVAGTFTGFLVGLAIAKNADAIKNFISTVTSMTIFPAQIYFLARLPSEINPVEVASIVAIAFFLSIAATIYPAFKAARLDPVEALRYQ